MYAQIELTDTYTHTDNTQVNINTKTWKEKKKKNKTCLFGIRSIGKQKLITELYLPVSISLQITTEPIISAW